MFEVSGAFGPKVHNYVDDRAARGSYQFCFGSGRILEVHAAQRAFALVKRNVGLRDHRFQSVIREFMLTERAREKTPAVFQSLYVNNVGALKLCFGENHIVSSLILV